MVLRNYRRHSTWVVIEILMIAGLLVSLKYLQVIEEGIDCGCIIGEGLYLSYIINYSKLFGIRAVDISVTGFLLGSLAGILALLNFQAPKRLLTYSSLFASVFIIPYYIYLEINLDFICIYCSILQLLVITTAVLSIYALKGDRT